MLSLRKILAELVPTAPALFGAENIVDLLYSRTGQFEIDWTDEDQLNTALDENICKEHFKELYAEFETRKSGHARINSKSNPSCLYNDIFVPESRSCIAVANNKIKKSQAKIFALRAENNIVIQPGAGFCTNHWALIMAEINKNQKTNVDSQKKNESDEEMDSDDSPKISDSTEDENFKPSGRLDPELDQDKIAAVNELGKLIGVERIITRDSFVTLGDRTKREKVAGGRSILKFFFGAMAPEDEEGFGTKVCSVWQPKKESEHNPGDNIIKAVGEQYGRAPDKIMKQIILGPVASISSYKEVSQHIPGISFFLFNKARKCFKAEEIPKNLKKTFAPYDEAKITDFVEFFTNPHCTVLMPYGERSVTLSNNEKLDIAANMRMQSSIQIIRMYRKMKEEQGFGAKDILPLSTMYAILNLCHASKSKELTCVDYYLAAALDGFEILEEIIAHWLTTEDVTVEENKMLVNELKSGQEYLKTDFPMHLEQHSEVISHCLNHALGDPLVPEFTNTCDEHLTVCPRCQSLLDTLETLKNKIDDMVENCKKEKETCTELDDLETKQIQIHYAKFR